MKTKEGFGGLVKGGLKCEIIKIVYYNCDQKYHVAILLESGGVFWGLVEDLAL